jgi:predicted nucleic acid-binding protein
MNDKNFLDTNILVYLFDQKSPKYLISQNLVISAIESGNAIISFQVVQEFLNLVTGKFSIKSTPENTREFMQTILFPLCQVFPDLELYMLSLDIKNETHYSFYDSLILAAALRGGCNVLYSEDLQSGQKVRGLEIVNPYLPDNKLSQ